MAIIRNTASALRKGRVGNTTYYVLAGQQIARQSRNNSNYGETASRTVSQQTRRVKWSNLVNCYKLMAFWQKKAYESLSAGQTDYNKFMQLNINSSTVALTKDMAASGAGVWESWQISQGSLEPIAVAYVAQGDSYRSSLLLSSAITADTTIAALSRSILDNNAAYQDGDNIAFVLFFNSAADNGYYYPQCRYFEFTLDTSNSALFSTLPVSQFMASVAALDDVYLGSIGQISDFWDVVGVVMVHTRRIGGKLSVSSQRIVIGNPDFVNDLSTQAAIDAAIASYGVQDDVPLDPSFKAATISSVSVNGSLLPDWDGKGFLYNEAVELVITGEQLTEGIVLTFGGVEYTPLQVTANSVTYILGDNGTYFIRYKDGGIAFRIRVDGVVVPEGLPSTLTMYQMPTSSIVGESTYGVNRQADANASCINYPHMVTEDYEFFLLLLPFTGLTRDDFVCVNCTIVNIGEDPRPLRVSLSVTDTAAPAYITYQGFIVAVFNYS